MSYHDHAWVFKPKPQRPVRYRTQRSVWQRLQPILAICLGLGLAFVLITGSAALIARMHATQAQLEAAHLQGMAIAQSMCRSR